MSSPLAKFLLQLFVAEVPCLEPALKKTWDILNKSRTRKYEERWIIITRPHDVESLFEYHQNISVPTSVHLLMYFHSSNPQVCGVPSHIVSMQLQDQYPKLPQINWLTVPRNGWEITIQGQKVTNNFFFMAPKGFKSVEPLNSCERGRDIPIPTKVRWWN